MMGLFAQIISVVIVILGIPCGMIVGWIAKEELKEGKRYFTFLEEILFGLVFFFLLHSLGFALWGVLAGIVAFAFFSRFRKLRRGHVVYLLFLAALYLSKFDVLIASLMFIYGVPHGSILYMEHKSRLKKYFKWLK